MATLCHPQSLPPSSSSLLSLSPFEKSNHTPMDIVNQLQKQIEDSNLVGTEKLKTEELCFLSKLSAVGFTINGRVLIPGAGARTFGLMGKTSDAKVILNGGKKITFLRPDGYFSFHNISAGTHLIEVASIGYFFSPVRVDVSARNPGKVQAALTENRRILNELVLEPLREEQYYEIREPFSLMSLVKSPMGLMVGFMLVVVFLMPKLVENMDPEEMRRAQEEMRNQGVPSLSNLLPGAARGN